jgi:hypothetical protein
MHPILRHCLSHAAVLACGLSVTVAGLAGADPVFACGGRRQARCCCASAGL